MSPQLPPVLVREGVWRTTGKRTFRGSQYRGEYHRSSGENHGKNGNHSEH
jgi:hypothetical protein